MVPVLLLLSSDCTTKAGAKVDPVIDKALTPKSARGATTPQRIVSSILSTLIDDVVYASPEALVESILEDLVAKAVPRPLPPQKEIKKDVRRKEKTIDPGTKSGSATSVEVTSRAKTNDKHDQKVATQSNVKKNNKEVNSKESLPLSKLSRTDGQRVAMATDKDNVSSKNDGKTEYMPVPVYCAYNGRAALYSVWPPSIHFK